MFSEDEDDIFGGTPKSKFFDIVFNANRNLVEFEFEKLFDRYVAMEALLEETMSEEELEKKINDFILHDADKVNEVKNDLFIGFVGDVLTNNE